MRRHTTVLATVVSVSPKRRLALVAGTDVKPKDVLEMSDADINYAFMLRHKVPVTNIRVAGFTPAKLYARGAVDAEALEKLGFDALHLLNADFLTDIIAVYGHGDIVGTFLKTAYDAVALADNSAMQTLSLTISRLLEECAGCPTEAVAVLQQLGSIQDLSITTLLDTGVRGPQLRELGYTLEEVQSATGASPVQMAKLEMNR